MKICSKCHKELDLENFYVRKTGKRADEPYNHCKNCLRIRGKAYYHDNHDRQLELTLQRLRRNRETQRSLVNSLKNKPCADCGKLYPPYVMDFDHRDGNIKIGNIGTLVSQALLSEVRLLQEIAKCDLVCANCHRIRTFKKRACLLN